MEIFDSLDGRATETLVGDDVDVGNIQMVRLGEDSSAPMYFSSEERRPGGYNYYHRVYNSDGSDFQPSHSHRSEEAEEVDVEVEYPSHHIMNNNRDQFSAQPDVNQFYHFDEHQQQHQGYTEHNTQYYSREKEEEDDAGVSPYYSKPEDDSPDRDRTSYYSRRDQDDLSQYNENHVSVPTYEESFSNSQIEYADIDLSDDYDDYGMEIEFEHQLNRMEDGAGLHYAGDNMISRDNAKVYVSSDFISSSEAESESVDFVYDFDFNSY